MNWFNRLIAVFLLAVGSLSAADSPKHHHRGLVRIVAHAIKWVMICFCLMAPLFGQVTCLPGSTNPCCLTGGYQCGGIDEGCGNSSVCSPSFTAWFEFYTCCDQVTGAQYEAQYFIGCNGDDCGNIGNVASVKKPEKPIYVFDSSRIVMSLWERYVSSWRPIGRRGSCMKVRLTNKGGEIRIVPIPSVVSLSAVGRRS